MEQTLFETICARLELGALLSPPVHLTGGFLHQMYSFFTQKGKYALKLLNPEIMARETAMENYRAAEELEARLEQAGLPILPALPFGGRKMQRAGKQYFYLFDWYEGRALTDGEITALHCAQMGKALAEIHLIERRPAPCPREPLEIPWDELLKEAEKAAPVLFEELKRQRELLYTLQERGNRAISSLPRDISICHNDLDPKNVLWRGGELRIIDLECLSWDSPLLELYETALDWAGCDFCRFRPELLTAFLSAYQQAGAPLPEDWEALHNGNMVRLDWLRYNLDRALGKLGEDEREPGTAEALNALKRIAYYDGIRSRVLALTKTLS